MFSPLRSATCNSFLLAQCSDAFVRAIFLRALFFSEIKLNELCDRKLLKTLRTQSIIFKAKTIFKFYPENTPHCKLRHLVLWVHLEFDICKKRWKTPLQNIQGGNFCHFFVQTQNFEHVHFEISKFKPDLSKQLWKRCISKKDEGCRVLCVRAGQISVFSTKVKHTR